MCYKGGVGRGMDWIGEWIGYRMGEGEGCNAWVVVQWFVGSFSGTAQSFTISSR